MAWRSPCPDRRRAGASSSPSSPPSCEHAATTNQGRQGGLDVAAKGDG
jgi:hypothetical protein